MKLAKIKRFLRAYRKVAWVIVGALLIVVPIIFILRGFRKAQAVWWDNNYTKRQQITVTNNSTDSLASTTTVAISVDTKSLYDLGYLLSNCNDLRIVYQPDNSTATEVTRALSYSGGTACSTSQDTKIHFALQSALTTNGSSSKYYIYYDYASAGSPTSPETAYNIGSTTALLVCPFDGSSTCAGGETPSTATGTFRYSGGKTALSFNGDTSEVAYTGSKIDNLPRGDMTYEYWMLWNNKRNAAGYNVDTPIGKRNSSTAGWWMTVNDSDSIDINFICSGGTAHWLTNTGAFSENTWTHIAVVWDSTSKTPTLYINGTSTSFLGSTSCTGSYVNDSGVTFYVGRDNEVGQHFGGYIDEVRVSNTKRYTSGFTPITTPFIRDSNTKVLYHFDENGDDPKNSGKALDDSGNGIDGVLTDTSYVAGVVGIDSSSSDAGKAIGGNAFSSHEGLFVEEDTTNLITNPSFENSTYDTNWSQNGTITLTKNTSPPKYKFGSSSAKIVATLNAKLDTSVTVSAITYTLSAYVYSSPDDSEGSTVDSSIAQLEFDNSQQTPTYINEGGGWWRLEYTATATAGSRHFGVTVTNGDTVYVDGFQLEAKDYATSYADGSLGSGYGWDTNCDGTADGGTANNSCSARTVTSLIYNKPGSLTKAAGTMSVWVKPNFLWDTGKGTGNRNYCLFGVGSGCGDTSSVFVNYDDPNNGDNRRLNMYYRIDTDSTYFFQPADDYAWKLFTISWNRSANTAKFYINGTWKATNTTTDAWGTSLGGNVFIGTDSSSETYSDFRLYSQDLTDPQITDLYYAGLVSHSNGVSADVNSPKGTGPIATWHMNEGYGNQTFDSTTNGNDLDISNATWDDEASNVPNARLRSIGFANGGYLSRAYDSDFDFSNGDFSISGWFKHSTTAPSGTDDLIDKYGSAGFKIYMNSSGYMCFGVDDDSVWGPDDSVCTTSGLGSLADTRWHQFETVKNSTTSIQIYIDGKLINTNSSLTATGSLNTSSTIYMGVDSDGSSNSWDGNIDEASMYNYARTATQVKSDVFAAQTGTQLGAPLNDPVGQGLIGYWPMEAGGVTHLGVDTQGGHNDSGNGNLLLGSPFHLTNGGIATSMNIDVATISGQINLGIYSDSSGSPGTKLAETGPFTPSGTGWQSPAVNLITPVTLAAGDYWILHEPANDGMHYWGDDCAISCGGRTWKEHNVGSFGGTLPTSFGSTDDSGTGAWDVYANVTVGVSDNSGNSNSLTNNGSTTFSVGKFGNAPTFNGSSKYFNSSTTLNNAESLSFWVKPGSTTDNFINLASGVYIKATTGTVSTTGFTNPVIYINGVVGSTITSGSWQLISVSSSTPITADAFEVGRANGSYAASNTQIDDVRVYSRTITPKEVQQLYNWAPGPVGSWNFDENVDATAHDISGNGNDGSWQGTTGHQWRAGKFGSAGNFDGSTNYIDIPSSSSLQLGGGDFSISTWIYYTGPAFNLSHPGVITKGVPGSSEFRLQIDDAGYYVEAGGGAGSQISTGIIPSLNTWTYLTMVRSGTTVSVYKNTLFAGSTTLSGTTTNSTDVYIGADNNFGTGGTDYYTGLIDDLKIYNYAQTQKQIIADMNGGHPAGGSPIGSQVVYYKFNEQQGQAVNNAVPTTLTAVLGSSTASESSDPTWKQAGSSTCKENGCLDFDGSNDVVTVSSAPAIELDTNLSTGFTVSTWINADTAGEGSGGQIFNKGTNTYLRVDTLSGGRLDVEGKVDLATTDANLNISSAIATGTWNYVAMTYDGASKITIYINGRNMGSYTGSGATAADTNNLLIGGDSSDNFDGRIDEFKLYSSTLSDSEIQVDMNAGSSIAMGGVLGTQDNEGSGGNPPVGWWKFDEHTGTTATDFSGNGHDGTLVGSPTWVTGKTGSAVMLASGSHQYVSLANSTSTNLFDPANAFTISAWIYPTNVGGGQGIIFGGLAASNFIFDVSSSGVLEICNDSGGVCANKASTGSSAVSNNSWQYVSVTQDGSGNYHLYVNGQDKTSDGVGDHGSNFGASAATIGEWTSSIYFDGEIDNVVVYNYARTPAQIEYDYNRGAPVGWWKFDECTGGTAKDVSGNGNNGTITIGSSGSQNATGTCTSGNATDAWNNGATGKFNSSLNFDGNDDFVDIPDSDVLKPPIVSLSMWVKSSTPGDYAELGGLTGINFTNWAGNLRLNTSDHGGHYIYATRNIYDNQWHHLVGTYDQYTQNFYIDGKLDVSEAAYFAPSVLSYGSGGDIGGYTGCAASVCFNGQIDDVRVYNYALSASQVKTLHNNGAINYGPASGTP